MIRAKTLTTFGALALLAAGSVATAAPLVTVASTGADFTDVQSAIGAVDNNGVIEIIAAETLTGAIDLGLGPANYTIRKASSVSGEVILTNGTGGFVVYNSPGNPPTTPATLITQNSTRTLEGITFERSGGTGTVIDVDQSNPANNAFTVGLTLNNCIVRHTGPALGDTGEAIKLDDGFTAGALVTFTANNCTISATGAGTSQKSAFRLGDATWQNVVVNLTDTTITNPGYRPIRSDAGDNQTWNVTGCTITGPTTSTTDGYGRAILFATGHSNCTFNFTGTTITTDEECIYDSVAGSNNVWSINRCTFDNSVASTDAALRLALTAPNELNFFNNIVIIGEGSSTTNNRCLNLAGFDSSGTGTQGLYIYNNTFVGKGTTGSAVAIGGSLEANMWNNLFLNFNGAELIVGGSYASAGVRDSDNNIIVGPTDDSGLPDGAISSPTDLSYISASGGLSNVLAAAGLDSNYKPLAGSPILGLGAASYTGVAHPKQDILATIGNVDYDNSARTNPPAVGAKTGPVVTSVIDWSVY